MVIAQEIGEPSLDKQIQPTTMEKDTSASFNDIEE